jgi:hypothetical protein
MCKKAKKRHPARECLSKIWRKIKNRGQQYEWHGHANKGNDVGCQPCRKEISNEVPAAVVKQIFDACGLGGFVLVALDRVKLLFSQVDSHFN